MDLDDDVSSSTLKSIKDDAKNTGKSAKPLTREQATHDIVFLDPRHNTFGHFTRTFTLGGGQQSLGYYTTTTTDDESSSATRTKNNTSGPTATATNDAAKNKNIAAKTREAASKEKLKALRMQDDDDDDDNENDNNNNNNKHFAFANLEQKVLGILNALRNPLGTPMVELLSNARRLRKILANGSSLTNKLLPTLMTNGVAEVLHPLLEAPLPKLIFEVLWILSNITTLEDSKSGGCAASMYFMEKGIVQKIFFFCDIFDVVPFFEEIEDENPMNVPEFWDIAKFDDNGDAVMKHANGHQPVAEPQADREKSIDVMQDSFMVTEQACWFISNVMSDTTRLRDFCIKNGNIAKSCIKNMHCSDLIYRAFVRDTCKHLAKNNNAGNLPFSRSDLNGRSVFFEDREAAASSGNSNHSPRSRFSELYSKLVNWAKTELPSDQSSCIFGAGGNLSLSDLQRKQIAELAPPVKFFQTTLWTLTNVIRGKPSAPFEIIEDIAFLFCTLLQRFVDLMENSFSLSNNNNSDNNSSINIRIIDSSDPVKYALDRVVDGSSLDGVTELLWGFSYLTDTTHPENEQDLLLKDMAQKGSLTANISAILRATTSSNNNDRNQSSSNNSLSLLLNNPQLQLPAIRVMGNYCSGSDDATQSVVDTNIVSEIYPRLFVAADTKRSVRKEIAWTVSNICASGPTFIRYCFEDTSIFQIMFNELNGSINRPGAFGRFFFDHAVAKEVMWCLANSFVDFFPGAERLVRMAIDKDGPINALPVLAYLLNDSVTTDVRTIAVILEAIEGMLKVGDVYVGRVRDGQQQRSDSEYYNFDNPSARKPYTLEMAQSGILTCLENLQTHVRLEIFQKSTDILDTYFDENDEELQSISITASQESNDNNNVNNVTTVIDGEENLTTAEKFERMQQELEDLTIGEAVVKRNR